MNESSQYWKLVRINAAEVGGGYKLQRIPSAQAFFGEYFSEWINCSSKTEDTVQPQLFEIVRTESDNETSTDAELCLRCYVSHPILHSCHRRARLFGPSHGFTYRDLLPFVLNDDGNPQPGAFVPFSVEILNSYSLEHRCSLAKWADLRVRRNRELNQFLLERGLRVSSDWALLNRANLGELEGIDRQVVDAFHQVYRRDRPQQHRQGIRKKCVDPTDEQLQQMMQRLRTQQVLIHSPGSLLTHLKRIANELRRQEIWGSRGFPIAEPLETTDPETGETHLKEIPDQSYLSDAEASERSELQAFCYEQLLDCLSQGIQASIRDRIHSLEKRPRYAHLAHQVKPALRLLYFEGKSQGQIASLLGMTNQSQVSRILNPKDLLIAIRQRTIEALLHRILDKVREMNIAEFPLPPDYLSNLMQHLDAFVDEQVFQAATAEINTSRNRSMNSLYAQCLRQILTDQSVSPAA